MTIPAPIRVAAGTRHGRAPARGPDMRRDPSTIDYRVPGVSPSPRRIYHAAGAGPSWRGAAIHATTIDAEVHDVQQLTRLLAALRATDAAQRE